MTQRINLVDVRAVRREMCRLYRDARTGRVSTQDAARLCFVLATIRQTLESCDLERRVLALEDGTDAIES